MNKHKIQDEKYTREKIKEEREDLDEKKSNQKRKKQRYYINCISNNNNSFINISRSEYSNFNSVKMEY